MTLLNYLTRVHFADGVLEEALRSEMEHHAKRRPMIVAEEGMLTGAIAERFFASFPIRSVAQTFDQVPSRASEAAAQELARLYREQECDLLIAYGSSRSIDLAKAGRIAIAHDEPIAQLSSEEGGAMRIGPDLPDLYAVPGVLGFASAISHYTRIGLMSGGQVLLASSNLIPTVTICDPTLTLGAGPTESAAACGGVLARGIDAYLAPGYNPPADGLALDALARVSRNIDQVLCDDDLSARREMMAAGLNSSLSLQKGLCVVHAIANALTSVSQAPADPSTLGGILIPELVRFYSSADGSRIEQVGATMGLKGDVGDALDAFMARLPGPHRLGELGIASEDLAHAAVLAARDRAILNSPRGLKALQIEAILSAVH